MTKIVGTLGDDTLVGIDGQDNQIYGDKWRNIGGGNDTLIGGIGRTIVSFRHGL